MFKTLVSQNVDYPEFTFPCGDYPYELVWSDEFNDGVIDDTKWLVKYTWAINNELKALDYCFMLNNVYEEYDTHQQIGCLKLATRKPSTPQILTLLNDDSGQIETCSFDYTTGWIYTFHRNEWLYGKFEARIKVTGGYGLWPAYWLYGSYPYWNEIDIFEFYKPKKKPTNGRKTKCKNQKKNEDYQDRRLSTNIRIDWRNHDGDITNDNSILNSGFNPYYDEDYSATNEFDPLSSGFHIYTLEWDPYKIVWKLDGQIFRVYYHYQSLTGVEVQSCDIPTLLSSNSRNLYSNFPMELYFSNGIQQALLSNDYNCLCPDEAWLGSTLPETMDIDYIRIYKRSYCGENIFISDKRYKEYETEFILSENIDAAGNNNQVILDENSEVSYFASGSVRLHPGFHAGAGSHFIARIKPCTNYQSLEEDNDFLNSEQAVMFDKADKVDDESHCLLVFPNPNNGCFTLSFDPDYTSIEIIDNFGREIPFEKDGMDICCDGSAGAYFMRVICDESIQTYPFLIQK